jgi:hypothetical protein
MKMPPSSRVPRHVVRHDVEVGIVAQVVAAADAAQAQVLAVQFHFGPQHAEALQEGQVFPGHRAAHASAGAAVRAACRA